MNRNRSPRRKEIYLAIKLHLDTAELYDSADPDIKKHDFYRVEGKVRPIIVLADRIGKRAGQGVYQVVYSTTKDCDARGVERNDLVPFCYDPNTQSWAEVPHVVIPEGLFKNYKATLDETYFRELKRKIRTLTMHSTKE